MYIENVVLGEDIKSLLFAYKKGYMFIPSRNNIEPYFHEYLDYKFTYMQFGVSDKTPTTFRTNEGYKLYGPHKRELYDRLVNEMSLAGLILYLNQNKLVQIESDQMQISSKYFENQIRFKNLHVYNVGDSITDFTFLKRNRTLIYDWYKTTDKKFACNYDMLFIRDHAYIKRVMFVKNPISGMMDILVISKLNPTLIDPDKVSINSNSFELYEILEKFGIHVDIEPMLRETFDISRNVVTRNDGNIVAPITSMYSLLRLGANKIAPIWSIKKSLMGVKIPDTNKKSRDLRKMFNLSYDPIY